MFRGRLHTITSVVGITAALMAAVIGIAVAGTPPVRADHTPAHTIAQAGLTQTADQAGLGKTAPSLPVIIGNLINAALSMLGIIFLILMLYGGYIWMQAKGNTEDIEKAKKIIENAIIGIVVIGLAFAITAFVISRIAGAQTGETPSATSPASSPGGRGGAIVGWIEEAVREA